jgi:phosphoenolpyruvate synthase/pyruvate phosphate dikinase
LDYALDKYIKNKGVDIHKIGKKYYSFAQKEKYELRQIFKGPENFEEKLAEHALRYSWLQNDYSGEYRLSKEDFASRREEVLKEQIDYVDVTLQKPNSILEWADFLTMMRDERKKSNLIVDGLLDRYLSVECKKYKIPREIAVMSTVEEFEQDKNVKLKDYQGVRTAEITHDGLTDISNEKWEIAVKDTLIYDHSKTIKGVSAMPGKVIGNVKIVLSRNDFYKLNDGDILVTSMTRPEFTPVLSKISAIITNEGGITCHAAIVARELRKPCIIGTKIATRILKDGDKIDVDADLGIIRII